MRPRDGFGALCSAPEDTDAVLDEADDAHDTHC
jgi:hypothetical protein